MNENNYKKVLMYDLDKVKDWLFEELEKRPILMEQCLRVVDYLNINKILNNSYYSDDPVFIPGAVVLYNDAISEATGLSFRQVKRVKEYLSKVGLINFLKTIKTDTGYKHLWIMNLNLGSYYYVDCFDIIGIADIDYLYDEATLLKLKKCFDLEEKI